MTLYIVSVIITILIKLNNNFYSKCIIIIIQYYITWDQCVVYMPETTDRVKQMNIITRSQLRSMVQTYLIGCCPVVSCPFWESTGNFQPGKKEPGNLWYSSKFFKGNPCTGKCQWNNSGTWDTDEEDDVNLVIQELEIS